jgi:uncharacterized protein YoxC
MKAIVYVALIIVAGGAAFFSLSLSNKFQAIEKERIQTINTNKKVLADASVADKHITEQRAQLATSKEKQDLLTQSVSSLKSAETALKGDASKADDDLKAQDAEFADLEKTMTEVKSALAGLDGDVTLENLGDKVKQVQDDRTAKQKKLDDLNTLATGAEKSLTTSRADLDRLAKRIVERSSRIGKNSMEAVVTAVNQDWGFLVIGAGSNSGFTPQTALLVERDGRKIGRVRPSSIEPTQTIAEIDLESIASGVRLQPGDRVILAKPTSN